ncbi:MAG: F0F1 ATP synthase subunit A [Planctomycetota bacterium]|nr:F0F1 ATP synthase subunit A [Planctomycetota bacterium]
MTGSVLAAADPLDHVKDKAFGEGVLWHPGDDSALGDVFQSLLSIGVGKHIILFFVAGLLTLLFFGSYSWSAADRRVPGRWGLFVEMVLEFLKHQVIRPFMGTAGDKYLPLIASFFVYILCCNLLGLIPFFDFLGHGGNTATGSLTITAGLAACSFFIYHGIGIREQGSFLVYFKNLFPRVPLVILPLIVPIELVAHLIRPCALAIRLFANMLAGHTMMAAILGFTVVAKSSLVLGGAIAVVATAAATALTFLELLVAVIQAFVFTFLTAVFLSMAVHPEH